MKEIIKILEEIKEIQMDSTQLARTTPVYKLADKAIKHLNNNKAYTEEQVREAIEMAREPEYWDSGHYWGQQYTEDEIIEELNKIY